MTGTRFYSWEVGIFRGGPSKGLDVRVYLFDPLHLELVMSRSLSNMSIAIMKYKVALRRTNEGFSVSCPGLPGCWSR